MTYNIPRDEFVEFCEQIQRKIDEKRENAYYLFSRAHISSAVMKGYADALEELLPELEDLFDNRYTEG